MRGYDRATTQSRIVTTFIDGNQTNQTVQFYPRSLMDSLQRSDIQIVIPDASGFRMPTNYQYLKQIGSQNYYGSYTYRDGPTSRIRTQYDGVLSGAGAPPFPVDIPMPTPNDVIRCEVEALLKVKNQKVNYAVAMAEIGKAAVAVGGVIVALNNAALYLKQGKRRAAAAVLGVASKNTRDRARPPNSKELSGDWLSLQYGWLPLMSDVYGITEDLRARLAGLKPRYSVTRRIEYERQNYTKDDSAAILSRVNGKSKVAVFVRFDFEMEDSGIRQFVEQGLTNPAEIAWELVPFSFVVDWALPIGNLISACDATVGTTFKSGSKTEYGRVTRDGFLSPRDSRYTSLVGTGFFHGVKWVRTVYDKFPLPLPYYKNPLSAMHLVNAFALLRQRFS